MPAAGGDQPVAASDTRDFATAPAGATAPPSPPGAWRPPPPAPAIRGAQDPPDPASQPNGNLVASPLPPGPAARLRLSFPGVYLLAEGREGLRAVPDHRLTVDDDGLTLATADAAPVWSVPWSTLEQLAVPERSPLPDGHDGVVVEITTAQGEKRRCLVPAGHWWALGGAFEALARSRSVAPERERRLPWLLTAVLVLIAAAAVGALLLASGHLIRF